MKKRFRILDQMPAYSLEDQAKIVLACHLLHNFLRVNEQQRDELTVEEENEIAERVRTRHAAHQARPPLRFNGVTDAEREAADRRRDEIAEQLWATYQNQLRRRRMMQD